MFAATGAALFELVARKFGSHVAFEAQSYCSLIVTLDRSLDMQLLDEISITSGLALGCKQDEEYNYFWDDRFLGEEEGLRNDYHRSKHVWSFLRPPVNWKTYWQHVVVVYIPDSNTLVITAFYVTPQMRGVELKQSCEGFWALFAQLWGKRTGQEIVMSKQQLLLDSLSKNKTLNRSLSWWQLTLGLLVGVPVALAIPIGIMLFFDKFF